MKCAPLRSFLTLLMFLPAWGIAQDLLITNVRLVSPERKGISAGVDVAIVDGRIRDIGEQLAPSSPTTVVLAGRGRFLTPGLIDSHVHLAFVPGMNEGHAHSIPDIFAQARRQIPRSYLYHGFTSVVDLIAEPDWIAEWNAQELRPHAYFAGGAPIQDGYPTHHTPKEHRYHRIPNFLHDPNRDADFPAGFSREAHTPDAVVDRIADSGAVAVKTFHEDGFGAANDIPVPPAEVLANLVAAAERRGIPVILHANAETSQVAGVDAGVHAMAHGLWTWDGPDGRELPESIRALLDRIIAQDIAWQPTIQVLYGERDLLDPNYLNSAAMQQVVPADVLAWYASDDGQWWVRRLQQMVPYFKSLGPGEWRHVNDVPIRRVEQALTYLADHGGHLLFGSDTPSDLTYANPAGLNGRLEMNHWVAAGVSPERLFAAATLANARFFNLDTEIGSIEVGKRADLLLLEQNPLESIEAYDSIHTVIVAGRAIPRGELAANGR